MKVIQVDPCVPFSLGSERAAMIIRQAGEAARAKFPTESEGQVISAEHERLVALATEVLRKLHDAKMAGRLAHWRTTCRLDGCGKQPRTGKPRNFHKSRRRNFVFCPGHAGVKNLISKRDYRRLQDNANLRVVS